MIGAGFASNPVLTVNLTNNQTIVAQFSYETNAPIPGLEEVPVAHMDYFWIHPGVAAKFATLQFFAELLTNDTAPAQCSLALTLDPQSQTGGTVRVGTNWVFYTPPGGFYGNDYLSYSVSDGAGGVSYGTIVLQPQNETAPSANVTIQAQGDGSIRLTFAGIPGWTYRIQYTDICCTNWQDLATNAADQFGAYEYVDRPPTNVMSRFYRSIWP